MSILLSAPRLSIDGDQAKLSVTMKRGTSETEIFYAIPRENADWFALERLDGFLVGILLQAMAENEEIRMESAISSRLYHSLRDFFIPLVAGTYRNLSVISIVPSSLTDARLDGRGVATGFSAGVDSFAAVIQHFLNESSPDHKISHFLFNNVGSHGSEREGERLFRERLDKVRPFADEIGVPLVAIHSNIPEVLPMDFLTMHSAVNASIPLVLQNQFQRFYYASAYSYADCGVGHSDDFARLDPLALHLLSTESLECVSTGCQMSRVAKTELVASYEPSHRYLSVCVDPRYHGTNCSSCFKCRRTLLTLEMLGLADRYDRVFDLQEFRRHKTRYLFECLRYERASFEAEIAELIRKKRRGPFSTVLRLRRLWDRFAWR